MERKYPTPIKDLIKTILKTQNLEDGLYAVRVVNIWNDMFGKNFKDATTRIYVDNRVLVVYFRSSVVRDSLSYQRELIIEQINKTLGAPFLMDILLR